MSKHTNIGLVKHVEKAFEDGWKYVYGTIGQVLTENILKQKQAQYPKQIDRYLALIKTYIGKRTADCVNLVKSYLWWDDTKNDVVYDVKYDKVNGVWMSADGSFQVATEKGILATMPDIIGICVWKPGHMGVYIGNGQVIESKGTKYGVVKTPLHGQGATNWTHWLKYPGIEYLDEIEYYRTIIQDGANFDYPDGIWNLFDSYKYSKALYQKLAKAIDK